MTDSLVLPPTRRNYSELHKLGDLNNNVVDEIEHFFISYNEIKGKRFEVLGRFGPDRAKRVVEEAIKVFLKSQGRKTMR
jgi:inorganic pyrophosphatase